MEYKLYRILNKIAHLKKDLVSYRNQNNLTEDSLTPILKKYAEDLSRKSDDLVYKLETTTDPNVFQIRASRLKEHWKNTWDVEVSQVVFGIYGSVFQVSLYNPTKQYLDEAAEMQNYLPEW